MTAGGETHDETGDETGDETDDETHDTAFDRAIAGVPRAGGLVHDVTVDGGWTIGDKPNGGYLLATLARAAIVSGATVEGLVHDHPVTASAHYLSAPAQ